MNTENINVINPKSSNETNNKGEALNPDLINPKSSTETNNTEEVLSPDLINPKSFNETNNTEEVLSPDLINKGSDITLNVSNDSLNPEPAPFLKITEDNCEMTTIPYIDYFGEKHEIEVTKDFEEKYNAILKKERLIDRKETRRHTSLDNLAEKGFEFASSLPTPENEYEKSVLIKQVRTLIYSLNPSQQKLIRQLFYEGLTMTEISALENVSPSAIRHRWGRIKKKWVILYKSLKSEI